MMRSDVSFATLLALLGQPHVIARDFELKRYEWACGCEATATNETSCSIAWCIDHEGFAET